MNRSVDGHEDGLMILSIFDPQSDRQPSSSRAFDVGNGIGFGSVCGGGSERQVRTLQVSMQALKKWSWKILKGLDYLHKHEPCIIYTDLNCSNVFINSNIGKVKIGNLGLAAIVGKSHCAHSILGTPEFMASKLYEEDYMELNLQEGNIESMPFMEALRQLFFFTGARYSFPQIKLHPKAIEGTRSAGKVLDVFYCLKLLEATSISTVPGSADVMVGSRTLIGGIFRRSGLNRFESNKYLDYTLTPIQKERLQRHQERLNIPFDEESLEHQKALIDLWYLAYPDVKLQGLTSEKWKDMGWQGVNPSTDFRDSGVLPATRFCVYVVVDMVFEFLMYDVYT
ncbi:unnamed protein product [Lactuca saligna]|uniref:non-specific serine/threonine protein kinase n=1 Tax=Lactuca saligna TaxID=75948 RepID=A0AA36E8W9_LACSI|nr:unnamed protein product [Lactuca saligna]